MLKKTILVCLVLTFRLTQTVSLHALDKESFSEKGVAIFETYFAEQGSEKRWPMLKALHKVIDKADISSDKSELLLQIYTQILPSFDGCGTPASYQDQQRFAGLEQALASKSLTWDPEADKITYSFQANLVSEICYSANSHILILNAPLVPTSKYYLDLELEDTKRNYKNPLNMYVYHIASGQLRKARRNPEHFQMRGPVPHDANHTSDYFPRFLHKWDDYRGRFSDTMFDATVFEFGKRDDDVIAISSSYGDAGCRSKRYYGFNFISMQIDYVQACTACQQEEPKCREARDMQIWDTKAITGTESISGMQYRKNLGSDTLDARAYQRARQQTNLQKLEERRTYNQNIQRQKVDALPLPSSEASITSIQSYDATSNQVISNTLLLSPEKLALTVNVTEKDGTPVYFGHDYRLGSGDYHDRYRMVAHFSDEEPQTLASYAIAGGQQCKRVIPTDYNSDNGIVTFSKRKGPSDTSTCMEGAKSVTFILMCNGCDAGEVLDINQYGHQDSWFDFSVVDTKTYGVTWKEE